MLQILNLLEVYFVVNFKILKSDLDTHNKKKKSEGGGKEEWKCLQPWAESSTEDEMEGVHRAQHPMKL